MMELLKFFNLGIFEIKLHSVVLNLYCAVFEYLVVNMMLSLKLVDYQTENDSAEARNARDNNQVVVFLE